MSFKGISLERHLDSIFSELASKGTIYGFPMEKFLVKSSNYDYSARFHNKRVATPLGPAAGPHTQLAQNIISSYLGGGRIIELKTVQLNDQLEIPKPCIDMANVGYNVEWSQELTLQESKIEYLKAWILLRILEEEEVLGAPRGDRFYTKIFDMSLGYDMKGISSPQMKDWIMGLRDADDEIEGLLQELPSRYDRYKNLEIYPHVSNTVTLSTFHGCPPEEIESIVCYLMSEFNMHVMVKMNPTLLGLNRLQHLLVEELGYKDIVLDEASFEHDLSMEEATAMARRLRSFGASKGLSFGAKFTNTLMVQNHKNIFNEEQMYLSGTPLFVIAMEVLHRFRTELGGDFPVSFSGGVDKDNVVDALACNIVPVTVCSDLLKPGGYTRYGGYFKSVQKSMDEMKAKNIDELIRFRSQNTHLTIVQAGMNNAERLVARLTKESKYLAEKNSKEPKKLDKQLKLFDCQNCLKCISVCPNHALFAMPMGKAEMPMIDYQVQKGVFLPVPGENWLLEKERQIAKLAAHCNECGNCETFCVEHGSPYVVKTTLHLNRHAYEDAAPADGFYFSHKNTLHGRIDEEEYRLIDQVDRNEYDFRSKKVHMILDRDHKLISGQVLSELDNKEVIAMYPYYVMRFVYEGLNGMKDSSPSIILRGLFDE